MTSRERVLRALKIVSGAPDRVPLQFDLCRQHLEYFGNKLGLPVVITENTFDEGTWRQSGNEIRTAMGSDVVMVGAASPKGYAAEVPEDGLRINEYGMKMRNKPECHVVVEYPLSEALTKADIDTYFFPDTSVPERYAEAERIIGKYRKEYFVIGNIEVSLFSLACRLVGTEKLLADMGRNEEYVPRLFRRCTEFLTSAAMELIARGVDAICLGDEFATSENLLVRPDIFVSQVKPWYRRINHDLRKAAPEIVLMLRSDGMVLPLLNDIKDMGFNILNPIRPDIPRQSAKEMKNGYGHLFSFWGAIDSRCLLPLSTPEQLEAEIAEKITILGAGRGYMIAPANTIQNDISPQRVEKFIELSQKLSSIY